MATETYSKYDNIKITIQFGHSRSSNYKKAIRLCKQFPSYNLIEHENEVNECFIVSLDEYCQYKNLLHSLLLYVSGWKSTKIFIDDSIVSSYELRMQEHDIEIRLRASRNKKNIFRYALLAGKIRIESLPYPIVYYPGFYGTFIAFAKDQSSDLNLCSCSTEAVRQCLKLKKKGVFLGNSIFPDIMEKNLKKSWYSFNAVNFIDNLCHRCNMIPPLNSYCHEMYGSKFMQTYGWYVNQNGYKLSNHFADSKIGFRKEVENYTRQEFGFRKIGDRWINETMLYQIVSKIFKDEEILRHHRPDWLEGLELDIYIPRLNIAFEYQGQQHFHPVKAWGGVNALKSQQERDKRKLKICTSLGVKLHVIDYTEPLNEDYILGVLE